jgi:ribosomal protein S18 acetylase RimI-like enzyme
MLAESAGRPAGLLSYTVRPNLFHAGECFLIEELVVEPQSRRTGVGKALVEAAIAEAERRRCAEISVSTAAENRSALALYRGVGLTDEAVLLERHLKPTDKAPRGD